MPIKDNKIEEGSSKKRKRAREVQVVVCPTGFPVSNKRKTHTTPLPALNETLNSGDRPNPSRFLDWHDTAKEVRDLGATGFSGKKKRAYQDEQYKVLTGRDKKKHQVPLPIVRGIQKKAAERDARELKAAKEAGIVLPRTANKAKFKKSNATSRVHGPAPSIGFMRKGVLRVNEKDGGR